MNDTGMEPTQPGAGVQRGTGVQENDPEGRQYSLNRAAARLGVKPEFLATVLLDEGVVAPSGEPLTEDK